MATSSQRKSLKHKLSEALATTESAKKKRRSESPLSTLNDDSGIGSSVSNKSKTVGRKNERKNANISVKRQLQSDCSKINHAEVNDQSVNLKKEIEEKSIIKKSPLQTPSKKSVGQKNNEKRRKASGKCLENINDNDKSKVDTNNMDISQILALGEGISCLPSSSMIVESNSEGSDWEEVEESKDIKEPVIPKNGVDITLDAPLISFKRQKRELDMEGEVRRQLKRRQREIQELMHKVHLLCWIAHIKFVNSVLNSEALLSESLKVFPSKKLYPPKHADLSYLENVVKVFRQHISLNEEIKNEPLGGGLESELCNQYQKKTAFSKKALVYMFVVLLRALGVKVRLITSVVVVPLKPSADGLLNSTKSVVRNEVKVNKSKSDNSNKEEINKTDNTPRGLKNNLKKNLLSTKSNGKSKSVSKKANQSVEEDCSKKSPEKELDSDDEPLSKHFKVVKTSNKKPSPPEKKVTTTTKKSAKKDKDENFSPLKMSSTLKKKLDRRVLSSDDEMKLSHTKKIGQDVWVEVFLEAEEKWITVEVVKQKVHCIQLLYSKATQPVVYVLACNNNSTLKDVTRRYVPHWHSDTRKRRVAENWWNETLWPYLPPQTAQDKEEDDDIARQLQDMPLPTSISEYKSHPLYALKRHLLKFEGIYPADAPTLGFVRGEPVYGRECVVTLRSRDIWFKEARVVRANETPYKIVKSRPKYDRMTGEFRKDLPLELFGLWQTEDYIPPVAVDGKVPRNEYGNVDLFKPCMLPGGTVHLQIPALNRVARKLGIDCAPAVVGFEFHCGASHPVQDGFVVCEEFKDVLLEAWNKEVDESARRAEEKREKRIYGNWKRLVRGLIIRENLKVKYAFGENSDDESPTQSCSKAATQQAPAKKKGRACKK